MKINDDILISYTDIIYDKFLIKLFLKNIKTLLCYKNKLEESLGY